MKIRLLVKHRPISYLSVTVILALVLAACGDAADDSEDVATEPQPTPTEAATATPEPDPTPTPEPQVTDDTDDVMEVTPTPEPEEPTPEPTNDVDLAPELAGLTDWRNIEPVSLEDLGGEPVVLVFWNSI